MSKLSFRARALDAAKPMPVFNSEDIPDLPDFAAINRAVPQMPTGMEKEEECEHHLQRAISAQQAYGKTGDLVIPTPEVFCCSAAYEVVYVSDYKQPRQLIHMQPFAMEQDIPDYDMDSEDERWVNQQAKKMEINPVQFEEMMDRLEKGSGQQVVTLKEAKLLLKEDDDLIIAVYDYWLNKRLRTQHPLIPQVKTEKRDGSTNNNPYVAFRRRTEKMQTRKNRKNDETSYEKMLKLRRDLSRAVTVLEMVKRREKTKREHLHLSIEVYEKRYQAGDYSGQLLQEVTAMRPTRPAFVPVHNQFPVQRQDAWSNKSSKEVPRKKREYKRRKHKQQISHVQSQSNLLQQYSDMDVLYRAPFSSEEDGFSPGASDQDDDNDPDGQFSFKRKKSCQYQAPLDVFGNWPWCNKEDGGSRISDVDNKYRYNLTSLYRPQKTCLGFSRRRMGRGGRLLIDRAYTPLDDHWSDLCNSASQPNGITNEFVKEIRDEWTHFKPKLSCTSSQDNSNYLVGRCSPNNRTYVKPSDSAIINQTLLTCGLDALVNSDESGAGNVVPIEFTVENFQSHQKELLKMQKKQLKKINALESNGDATVVTEHSIVKSNAKCNNDAYTHTGGNVSSTLASTSAGSCNSNLTLDSASAKFAVSALVNTTQASNILNSSLPSGVVSNLASLVTSKNSSSSSCMKQPPVLNGPSSHFASSSDCNSVSSSVHTKLVNSVSSNCHDRKQLSSLLIDAPSSSTLMTSTSSLSLSSLLSSQPSVPTQSVSIGSTSSTNLSSLLSSSNTPVSILATRAITPQSTPDLKFAAETSLRTDTPHHGDNADGKVHLVKVEGLVNKNSLPTEVT